MDASFVDLDILLTKVRNAQSRTYFLDAVKAYKAGALRAALTAAWVALAYDLIAKYRELDAMGDAAATAFITSWDTATANNDVARLLKLEASLIEDAAVNTQAISQITRAHLERLHQDRHLCAHPAFSAEADLFEPSAELVRLHLVNVVDLVLSREPLQGKAIFDLYDVDVQSAGFPRAHDRILDYVEQRYLARVRPQSIRNFGSVLAKSLLKGQPPQWEGERSKIASSLVAIRERAPAAWPDIVVAVTRMIDTLDPAFRPRAVAFVAAFPDFWPLLQAPTQTALQTQVANTNPANLGDFRLLSGLSFQPFRTALLAVVAALSREQLVDAIAASPLPDFWQRAIVEYENSGGWRQSEANFRNLVLPFAGSLSAAQLDQLLDAIAANGENWDAGETSDLLLSLLRNNAAATPTVDARNRLYTLLRRRHRVANFQQPLDLLASDGWVPVAAAPAEDDDD